MKRSVNFSAPRRYYNAYMARMSTQPLYKLTCSVCKRVDGVRAHSKLDAGAKFRAEGWTVGNNGNDIIDGIVCPWCSKLSQHLQDEIRSQS